MDIIKVKIPVGKDGLVKKKFLANPWEEKGVGCAKGCIKIVLDDNMMDQIRSFKAMIHDRSFEHSRKYGVNEENTTRLDEIPTDIIPGRTDPYLIVEEPGVFFWVGGVDPKKLWTPETNDEGQYRETKIDGTIVYRLKKHLGKTVPPDSNSELNAYVVSNSTVDEGKPLYPAVPSTNKSAGYEYPTKGGKSKRRRTRRLKKKRKKKQTKKRKKKRRTKKRYKRRKKKSVRKRGKKKN